MELAAYGLKRIADMTREDLIIALNEMSERYMMLCRSRMSSNEVPIFHEDMYEWNAKLEKWFTDTSQALSQSKRWEPGDD